MSVMQELIRRGGIKAAIAGREGTSLQILLKFIQKYVSYCFSYSKIFSSPEPMAQSELLWFLDVRCPSLVVCFQQLLQSASPPKLLAGF